MSEIVVRPFNEADMSNLGELYQAVISKERAVFWWVGEKENWSNVFVAYEGDRMIAKGQVSIVLAMMESSKIGGKHQLFFNLKTLPERETDYRLYDLLYAKLVQRAGELQEALLPSYETEINVGNDSTEKHNNAYFIEQGFCYKEIVITMKRAVVKPIESKELPSSYHFIKWDMRTEADIAEYLAIDEEIWPAAPIGLEKLKQIRQYEVWTALTVRDKGTLIASVMAWKVDKQGTIEEVFVREKWRNQGLAKFLLGQAIIYLKNNGCDSVELQVEVLNKSALKLYQAVGFEEVSEELRFSKSFG